MEATLKAVKRDTRGKNEARRLRVAGQIPAVVYGGPQGQAVAISVEPKELSRILHSGAGENTLIDLAVDGDAPTKVLVKDYLLNPITQHLLHADFYRVSLDKPIQVKVRVELQGEPKGVKQQGGILDFVTREIEVEVLPTQIPDQIVVDVSDLALGQSIRRPRRREGCRVEADHGGRAHDRPRGAAPRRRPKRRRRPTRRRCPRPRPSPK